MASSLTPRDARTATREAILQAASRRFARFGPKKTTMDEIAREAGCSRATVYTHFSGKDALYRGLLEYETQSFLAQVEAAVSSSEPAQQKLVAIQRATLGIYAERPVLHGALTGDVDAAVERIAQPAVRRYEKQVTSQLERVLREGVEQGVVREMDTGAVAFLMYQLGAVLVTHAVGGHREYPLARILGVMTDLLARGIQTEPGASAVESPHASQAG